MILEPLPDDLRSLVVNNFNCVPSGFCSEEKAIKLAEVVWTLKPKWSVEIGVFGGKSFIPISTAVLYIDHNRGNHRAFGVDIWEANVAADQYQNTPHENYWGNQSVHNFVRDQAFQAVKKLRTHSVQLYVSTSEEASLCFNDEEVGLCHIDGNHSELHVHRDLNSWWPKIQTGGVIVLDDLGWIPEKAVNWVKERSSLICEVGSSAFFKKEK
jgi:hypothetical protein